MPWFYHVGKIIIRIVLLLVTRRQVKGKENVPREGALLVIANHLHSVDPPLLSISLPRRVIFMAKEELFRYRFIAYFIRSFGAFPVYRKRSDGGTLHQANQLRETLQQAKQVLAQGLALGMFPEGARSKSSQLQQAFPGSVAIALRSGVPILPVGITGTEKMKGVTWLLCRPQITVNIGPPFRLSSVRRGSTKADMAMLTNLMMERIAELLPPEYQGYYAGGRQDEN